MMSVAKSLQTPLLMHVKLLSWPLVTTIIDNFLQSNFRGDQAAVDLYDRNFVRVQTLGLPRNRRLYGYINVISSVLLAK